MKVVAIIQARMGSTRLPGKVLKDIGGATMLARVVRRAQQAKLINEVIVATTTQPADADIVSECSRLNVPAFRGDEQDVLDRYYQVAQTHHAQAIVRITSDCPLIDPAVTDKTIQAFLQAAPDYDYASNTLQRTYPRGLDTEVMTFDALERAWRETQGPFQRVHVTPYFYQNPAKFKLLSVTHDQDYSHYRWTVDTLQDLAFVQTVYARLGNRMNISWQEVLALLEREPELAELNRDIQQKALHEG